MCQERQEQEHRTQLEALREGNRRVVLRQQQEVIVRFGRKCATDWSNFKSTCDRILNLKTKSLVISNTAVKQERT